MIFTPRILTQIWNILRWSWVFDHSSDAPSLEAFLAHYAAANAKPQIFWSSPAKGAAYLYDLSINLLQINPPTHRDATWVDGVNGKLWAELPPRLLEEPADWNYLWLNAVNRLDVQALTFILEQGFDARAVMQPDDWRRMWVKAAMTRRVGVWQFILDQDVDADAVASPAEWRRLWEQAMAEADLWTMDFVAQRCMAITQRADWRKVWDKAVNADDLKTLRFVTEKGENVAQPADWKKLWGKAVEVRNREMMRFILKQDAGVVTPADWAEAWKRAVDAMDAEMMRLILEQGFDSHTVMHPADWKTLWFKAAEHHHEEMLKLLLGQGFDVNTLDEHGRSALPYVVSPGGGNSTAVKLLVEAGIHLGDVEKLIESGVQGIAAAGECNESLIIAGYLRAAAAERGRASAKDTAQS